MHDNERQELNALRAEKMSLQAKVDNLAFFYNFGRTLFDTAIIGR